jgi:hypothetical protein
MATNLSLVKLESVVAQLETHECSNCGKRLGFSGETIVGASRSREKLTTSFSGGPSVNMPIDCCVRCYDVVRRFNERGQYERFMGPDWFRHLLERVHLKNRAGGIRT